MTGYQCARFKTAKFIQNRLWLKS